MSGHTTEEKLKILYEDSLRDIRRLAKHMEYISSSIKDAAELIGHGKSVIRAENERILLGAVNDINNAVVQISAERDNLNGTTVNTVRALLTGDDGPIKLLDNLVRRQNEALGWLNKAAHFYEYSYVTKPMVWALVLGGLSGGIAGGVVCSYIVKLI